MAKTKRGGSQKSEAARVKELKAELAKLTGKRDASISPKKKRSSKRRRTVKETDEESSEDESGEEKGTVPVGWKHNPILTTKLLAKIEASETYRQAFGFSELATGRRGNVSKGLSMTKICEELAQAVFHAETAPDTWKNVAITSLGKAVKARVAALKKAYGKHKTQLGKTGHGLVMEDVHSITPHSNIANIWDKLKESFPWYQTMSALMLNSPIIEKDSVLNSGGTVDLSALTGGTATPAAVGIPAAATASPNWDMDKLRRDFDNGAEVDMADGERSNFSLDNEDLSWANTDGMGFSSFPSFDMSGGYDVGAGMNDEDFFSTAPESNRVPSLFAMPQTTTTVRTVFQSPSRRDVMTASISSFSAPPETPTSAPSTNSAGDSHTSSTSQSNSVTDSSKRGARGGKGIGETIQETLRTVHANHADVQEKKRKERMSMLELKLQYKKEKDMADRELERERMQHELEILRLKNEAALLALQSSQAAP